MLAYSAVETRENRTNVLIKTCSSEVVGCMNKVRYSQGNLQCPLPQDPPQVRKGGHETQNCLYEEAAVFIYGLPSAFHKTHSDDISQAYSALSTAGEAAVPEKQLMFGVTQKWQDLS